MTSSYLRVQRERDSGASAVEYGLLVAAIAALIVVIVFAVGKLSKRTFDDTCEAIKNGSSSTVNSAADCP